MPKTKKTPSTMDFVKQLERLERIDQLIKRKATGNPAQLANTLELSERRVYQLIKKMKEELDAKIYYDKQRNSYCYEEKPTFSFEVII